MSEVIGNVPAACGFSWCEHHDAWCREWLPLDEHECDARWPRPEIQVYWKNRLIVLRGGNHIQYHQIDRPASEWAAGHTDRKFLIVTSHGPLASHLCRRTHERILERDPNFAFNTIGSVRRNSLHNPHGGHMIFLPWGAGLAGYRFDEIIVSDPTGEHKERYDEVMQWVSQLRTKLPPG